MDKIIESPVKFGTPNKRKRESSVTAKCLEYFEFEKSVLNVESNFGGKKFYKCKFCKELKNGTNEGNLAAHLKVCNPVVYSDITGGEKDPAPVKRLKLIQNMTEMVTVNGRTFTALTDSGFLAILSKELDELRVAGCPLHLSDNKLPEIKEYLAQTAEKVRSKIKSEVKKRPLSLICDIVSKHHRALLGVSIQYVHNKELKIRSIGMIELHERHTGLNLAEQIIEILKSYEIETKQVIAIATDNGANVLKMVRDVENLQEIDESESVEKQSVSESPADSNELTDNEIANILAQPESEFDDEDALDELFGFVESAEHHTLLSNLYTEMEKCDLNTLWNITGVNCAAHTLQLAIKDAVKSIARIHKNVIELSRKVTKILRLKSTTNEANNMGIHYLWPHLENDTRWCSLFMMVCFLKTM